MATNHGLMRYELKESGLWAGHVLLGPADAIIIDIYQPTLKPYIEAYSPPGVVLARLPVGDYLFVNKQGKLVGVEEKRIHDLTGSWSSRRLHRQLRHLKAAVDIPILALRGVGEELPNLFDITTEAWTDTWEDVLKWSLAWGIVAFTPSDDGQCIERLRGWKVVVADGHSLMSVVAGDDRSKRKEAPTLSPIEQAFIRLLPGVGPVLAASISAHFKNNLAKALVAPLEKWATIKGVHKGVLSEVAKLQKG